MSPLEVAEAFVRLSANEAKVKSISLASVELARTFPRVGWAVVRGCAVVTGIAALHWSRSQAPVNRKSLLTGRSYELRAKAAYRIYADVSFGPVATAGA